MSAGVPGITVDISVLLAEFEARLAVAEQKLAATTRRMGTQISATALQLRNDIVSRNDKMYRDIDALKEAPRAFGRNWNHEMTNMRRSFEDAARSNESFLERSVGRMYGKIARAGVAVAAVVTVDQGLRSAAEAVRGEGSFTELFVDGLVKATKSIPVIGAFYDLMQAGLERVVDPGKGERDRQLAAEEAEVARKEKQVPLYQAATKDHADTLRTLGRESELTVASAAADTFERRGDWDSAARASADLRAIGARHRREDFQRQLGELEKTWRQAGASEQQIARMRSERALAFDTVEMRKEADESARADAARYAAADARSASGHALELQAGVASATTDRDRIVAEREYARWNAQTQYGPGREREREMAIRLADATANRALADLNKSERGRSLRSDLDILRDFRSRMGTLAPEDMISTAQTAIGTFRFAQADAGAKLAQYAKESLELDKQIERKLDEIKQLMGVGTFS